MFRCLLTAVLVFATTLTATAQAVDSPAQSTPAAVRPRSVADWPAATRYASQGHKLAIVTIAKPGIRQSCNVGEITEDSIVCRAVHHKKITYQRDEIASIIDPPSHSERNIMLIPIVLLAASLAGSFFVPLAWSITLRIVAGLSLCVFGADGIGAAGTDHNNDILIYQRPNTPLTIHLHA